MAIYQIIKVTDGCCIEEVGSPYRHGYCLANRQKSVNEYGKAVSLSSDYVGRYEDCVDIVKRITHLSEVKKPGEFAIALRSDPERKTRIKGYIVDDGEREFIIHHPAREAYPHMDDKRFSKIRDKWQISDVKTGLSACTFMSSSRKSCIEDFILNDYLHIKDLIRVRERGF